MKSTLTRKARIHVSLCWNCRQPLTRQERAEGVCAFCADAPAVADVHPCVVVAWAMSKARREQPQETGNDQPELSLNYFLPMSHAELELHHFTL
jgi:hypothetical protein